jgi:hypothetical protein
MRQLTGIASLVGGKCRQTSLKDIASVSLCVQLGDFAKVEDNRHAGKCHNIASCQGIQIMDARHKQQDDDDRTC